MAKRGCGMDRPGGSSGSQHEDEDSDDPGSCTHDPQNPREERILEEILEDDEHDSPLMDVLGIGERARDSGEFARDSGEFARDSGEYARGSGENNRFIGDPDMFTRDLDMDPSGDPLLSINSQMENSCDLFLYGSNNSERRNLRSLRSKDTFSLES